MPPSIYGSNQPTETVVVSHKKIASIDSSKKKLASSSAPKTK
jgi:hypothetical protein